MVTANILDPVHDTLDPTVWDAPHEYNPVLKPQHKDWILSTIHNTLRENGYGDSDSWLEIYLTGSLTTYQYSEDSDCDISLFVNADVFPEWSRAEMIGVMVGHVDGTKLPGTTHPMQCYVVAKGIRPQDLYKPGLRSGYLISQDRWVVPPEKDRVHDVQVSQKADYQYALQQADKMERLLKYEPYRAVQFWHQIHRRRQEDMKRGRGDYTQSNIIYKFLANRGLFPEISQASGEYIAKTAGVPGWEPGLHGKFVVTPEGQVHQWRTYPENSEFGPEDARPHHGEYIRNVLAPRYQEYMNDGDNDEDNWTPGWITPEGKINTLTWPRGHHERRALEHVVPNVSGTFLDPIHQRVVQRMLGSTESSIRPHFIDHRAVEIAARKLGLRHPVEVRTVGGTYGSYDGVQNGKHILNIVGWLNPESASLQTWHELVHAMQYEQDPEAYAARLEEYNRTRDQGHDAYENHPWEQQARQLAAAHPFKLALPRVSNTLTQVAHEPTQASHTGRETSEADGPLRGAHRQAEVVDGLSGIVWSVLGAGEAGQDNRGSHHAAV